MTTGAVLIVVGTFMTSISTTYWQVFLAQGVCTGIGNGFLFTPAMTVISTYFARRRAVALAAAACGSTVGGLVFPSMARTLLPSIGFGWTMRAIGFLQLGTLAVALSVVRTREMPRKKGPLLDLAAFGEPEYTLYATGAFLVSIAVLVLVCMALADFDLIDIHWRFLPILLPCPICPRYPTPFL